MSISMAPTKPRTVSVGVAEDPYKKYWWAILAAFGLTAGWLIMPMMETSVGSARYDPSRSSADASGEQGLDVGSGGAAAKGYELTKGAAKSKDAWSAPESMLYQGLSDATAGASAAGAPLGSASGGASASLAQSLKNVGLGKDAAGWGGEKARRGFDAPHMGAGSLSGLGSVAGGGHSSASASSGAFGFRGASVSESGTRGLVDDGSAEAAAAGARSMGGLNQMATSANRAALEHSTDKAASGMSKLFDGAKGSGSIVGGNSGALAGTYESLDSAPVNLKANPADLDTKKMDPPPSAPPPPTPNNGMQQMLITVAGMAASALIGGMVGGTAGQMIMMAGPMMAQTISQQQAAQQQAAQQQAAQQKINSMH